MVIFVSYIHLPSSNPKHNISEFSRKKKNGCKSFSIISRYRINAIKFKEETLPFISFISFVPEIYVSVLTVTLKSSFPIYTTDLRSWTQIFESCDFFSSSIFRVVGNIKVISFRI